MAFIVITRSLILAILYGCLLLVNDRVKFRCVILILIYGIKAESAAG